MTGAEHRVRARLGDDAAAGAAAPRATAWAQWDTQAATPAGVPER